MVKVKNIAVALILVAIMVAAASVPAASATTDKSVDAMESSFQKAREAVISAAPPAKRSETIDAMFKQTVIAANSLAEASGDENKVAAITAAYRFAADAVIAAAPTDKFALMEETFKEAARPIA